jgi:ubiquinol oxidase
MPSLLQSLHLQSSSVLQQRMKSTNTNYSQDFGDHSWRQQNHIWTDKEIGERIATADLKHVPKGLAELALQKTVRVAYHCFNAVTGYNALDPPVSAIGYRLIILESVAGVPGMLGGMFRHFRSLRQLERDHGFIFTLLEEAENERMHLIVCMSFFEAGPFTRLVVSAGQVAMTPFLTMLYLIRPQYLHRFVGYLEETAVHTYTNIVKLTQTPGTKLHTSWKDTPAPEVAIAYWQMPADAKWVDCLSRMLADESHHRDVNHALASMPTEKLYGNDNPFVHEHIADYEAGVKRRAERVLKRAIKNLDDDKIRSDKPLS